MEQSEEIYKKIKEYDLEENNEIIKNIISIDGAIVQESSLGFKQKLYSDLENKYYLQLSILKYYTFIEEIKKKNKEFVDSEAKKINALLGMLKLFFIRMAAFNIVKDKEIDEIKEKISKEDRHIKLSALYEKLDNKLLNLL